MSEVSQEVCRPVLSFPCYFFKCKVSLYSCYLREHALFVIWQVITFKTLFESLTHFETFNILQKEEMTKKITDFKCLKLCF